MAAVAWQVDFEVERQCGRADGVGGGGEVGFPARLPPQHVEWQWLLTQAAPAKMEPKPPDKTALSSFEIQKYGVDETAHQAVHLREAVEAARLIGEDDRVALEQRHRVLPHAERLAGGAGDWTCVCGCVVYECRECATKHAHGTTTEGRSQSHAQGCRAVRPTPIGRTCQPVDPARQATRPQGETEDR